MAEIAAPRGMRDVLPGDADALQWLLDTHRQVAESFGYRAIETPVVEHTELFARGVGSDTDVVEKQMFSFEDRGGRSLTLRPEGTAGVVRAVLAHRLEQELRPVRVHYAGPFFRAERPAAGKQRQFAQVGVECIGERSPHVDVEVIEAAWRFFAALGIDAVRLQVNSLGDAADRARYQAALVDYYEPHRDELCPDCRRRLSTNPLRLLDCKIDQRFVAGAPSMWDSLSAASRAFFTEVLAGLEDAGITATVNHRLVRGLDYYTDTAFEFWHDTLHGAQNALGGGGRYDGLAAGLGFPDTPGIGYALGVERTLIVATELDRAPAAAASGEVLVCSVAAAQAHEAARLARTLRSDGRRVVLDAADRRLDRKLRHADRLGARVAVIAGEEEVRAGRAVVRDLQAHTQESLPLHELVAGVGRILDGA